jgi:adenylate cyclase
MIIAVFLTVYDHFTLHTLDSAGPAPTYSFRFSLLINLMGSVVAALTGGSLLVFYVNVKYQDKPYAYTIAAVVVACFVIIEIISFLLGFIVVPHETGRPMSDPLSKLEFKHYFFDSGYIKSALAWSGVVAITQLLLQVSSKFGQANFWNIVHGRYNRPQAEKRIFMFLDINSSTSIAEHLGDEAYHALLKDFFADITGPILENKGNIYQYVGDEVVIAWNYADGKKNLHCLNCFFDMKLEIQRRKQKYLDTYGLIPTFKAGIHCGNVVAGEVGIIKRDITYSGDVLNTTSRILSKCGEFGEEFLASTEVLAELEPSHDFVSRPLGAIKLKGKEKETTLNALKPA